MPEVPRQQTDPELRQLAMQIASMLPEDSTEARKVLRLANSLVDKFLAADDPPPPKPTVIDDT